MTEQSRRPPISPLRPRALLQLATLKLRAWAAHPWLQPLFAPLQQPSRWRVRFTAMATLFGHPLFYAIWGEWLPQPYEDELLRVLMTALGLMLLLVPGPLLNPPTRGAGLLCMAVFWITQPLFFAWMYFCNGGNAAWLASLGVILVIYHQLTDWRVATVGSAAAIALAWWLSPLFGPATPAMAHPQAAVNTVVLAFCWIVAFAFGLSSANLRRQQLASTLATMGIMAHELRTPLATMQLIGEALRAEAREQGEPGQKLDKLAQRLTALVRNMNHQVDLQIANARLMELPTLAETLSAAQLVREAIADFPFRSSRERECVEIRVHGDFRFAGSRRLFGQLVDNLAKNALRSLAEAGIAPRPGDLLIEVGAQGERGRIVFTDRGVGIEPGLQPFIFQPFFSTDRATGHGLGLAFCQRVVQAAGGTLRVKSAPLQGAMFTVELPLA